MIRILPLIIVLVLTTFGSAWAGTDGRLRVVMLGDSLTAGYDWPGALPEARVVNQGISGDTTTAIAKRLDRVAAARPDIIFLQAGINDLAGRVKPEIVLERHLHIWEELHQRLPGSRLYVVSLLPVCGRYDNLSPAVLELNGLLRKAAQDHSLVFIDVYPLLADNDGKLRRNLTHDDLHLRAEAYPLWVGAIKPYINDINAVN